MSENNRHKTQSKFYKQDFLSMYDNVSIDVFEEWIQDIKSEIGWKEKKKQVFSPRVARMIIEHVGEPIRLSILNQ